MKDVVRSKVKGGLIINVCCPQSTPASVAHHRSIGKILLKYWRLYVLLLPAAVYRRFQYGPCTVYRLLQKFSTSKVSGAMVGFDQFVKLFNLPIFVTLLRNTLVITIYSF